MNSKIDFVITWVDGNDPAWQKERAVYSKSSCTDEGQRGGIDIHRYRDWDLMRFWFRGI